MTQPADRPGPIRTLVGDEDLLQPTPKRWWLLGAGLLGAVVVGVLAGFARPYASGAVKKHAPGSLKYRFGRARAR